MIIALVSKDKPRVENLLLSLFIFFVMGSITSIILYTQKINDTIDLKSANKILMILQKTSICNDELKDSHFYVTYNEYVNYIHCLEKDYFKKNPKIRKAFFEKEDKVSKSNEEDKNHIVHLLTPLTNQVKFWRVFNG